jgi:hypothetical protein
MLAALLLGAVLGAPDRPSGAPEQLVGQLGAPDFRLRDEAARRLEALGLPALPALRRALGSADPEVRRRARDLIPAIETAAFLAPRRVSLHLAGKPLRAVFDEVTRQTGYKIEFWASNPNQPYTFDFHDLTFWEALDHVCASANLVLQPNYGDDRLLLQEGGGPPPFVRYEGPFRLVPTNLQQTRTINLGPAARGVDAPALAETLSVSFTLFAEPRLPILGIGEAKLDAAYDTEKNSMLEPAPGPGEVFLDRPFGLRRHWSGRYGNGNRGFQVQTQLNLHRPSHKAAGIRSVRGSLPVTLLVEQQPVVLTDRVLSAKGKKATAGTTTFSFEDVAELPGKQYQLKLSVTEDNRDNPGDFTWMNTLYQRIELADEAGTRYQIYGSTWGNSGASNVQMTLTFGPVGNAKTGPPGKFIFHRWTTLQHAVPFEFRDLPLP